MRLRKATNEHERVKVDVLVLGIFSLIAVLIWVGYSLYDTFIQSTIEPEVEALLEPLDPNLNSEVLSKLQDHYVPPEEFTILAVVRDSENGTKQIVPLSERATSAPALSEAFEDSNASDSGSLSE